MAEAPLQEPWDEHINCFLQGHEEKKAQCMATGSSDFTQLRLHQETPWRASTSSGDSRRRPSEAHVSSIASGETRRSSIFDSIESSSSTTSVLPGRRLPCEFHWYGDCEETFDLRNINGWVDHVESHHLEMTLPMACWCWFCDDVVFRAQSDTIQQRRRCYTDRMNHIAEHYRQGATINDIRPDFEFLHHLRENDLISRRNFLRARDFHEAPQPRNGINSVPAAPVVNRAMAVEVRSRRRGRPESQRSYHP
ncbi:hypothetical protein V8C42DRAFT_313861 [Trichoderma barbatum]